MSRRILLADDSVTIQKVIELTFMDEDYEVTAVSNGDEAIALLDQLRPDFVIADVHMPGANGYAVCRRAKEVLPGVPVLLLVGTFEPFDEGQSRAAAADAFLKKPFDSQELLQLVEQLLGGRGSSVSASAPAAASEASEPGAFDFDAPLGATTAASEALPASDFGDPVAEPIWGHLDVDAAGDAPAPTAPANPWSASAPAWEAAPTDEQVFELDADADIEDLTLGDDSLLPGEAEPFRFTGDGESLEPVGGLETLPSDEAPFRFDPAPETALPFAEEEPFRFGEAAPAADGGAPFPKSDFALETADLPEPLRFGGPVAVPAAADEQPFRFDDDPAGPSAEERLGIPAAALPLVSGIDELEQRVHEHEAAPAFETADPLPPAEEALMGGSTAGTAEAAPAAAPSPAASIAASGASVASGTGEFAGRLSDEDVDRIARRLLELAGEKVVRDVAWEVVPDMAELVIKDRLRELEAQVE